MAYYEGVDYIVRKCAFPNRASEAFIVSNGDGTVTIFLNTLFSEDILRRRLEHELRHLNGEHLYQEDRPLWEKEAEAEGETISAASPEGRWEAFRPVKEKGTYLSSWRRAMDWADRMMRDPEHISGFPKAKKA